MVSLTLTTPIYTVSSPVVSILSFARASPVEKYESFAVLGHEYLIFVQGLFQFPPALYLLLEVSARFVVESPLEALHRGNLLDQVERAQHLTLAVEEGV